MKISVIGTGYVGLVTGVCLAELGHDVMCVDVDQDKIDLLREGCVPIHESGLAELLRRNRRARRLHFSSDIDTGVRHGEVLFIAVGTPAAPDGSANLCSVFDAAQSIAAAMDTFRLIVIKSTVPVGTAERVGELVRKGLEERALDCSFCVLSNPEFLKEGVAVRDFMAPDRIVIGCPEGEAGERARAMMREVYAGLDPAGSRCLWMAPRAAEFTKYAANAMLATRVSFINEMANLADAMGVDIEAVRCGIGADRRIGAAFLQAGCGYGGSCLPKDVQALRHTARQAGLATPLLDAVDAVNARQKRILFDKIVRRFGSDLQGRCFAMWGLTFKPNTDDMREAPSRVLIRLLLDSGAAISMYDPVAMAEAQRVLYQDHDGFYDLQQRLRFGAGPLQVLDGADALVIATDWQEFRQVDPAQISMQLKSPVVFDGRNLYAPAAAAAAGLEYYAIGRSAARPS
ncbi:MAG TPA: UDP-glucose/GDP-mannose dehydrogenase family protein [Noviherbaspirillum sp.]|nr:UDP-glucose/GDP-mannose dehydrogenase family protein [Noviherbaspirillum sp.]